MNNKPSAKPGRSARNKIKSQYQKWVNCYGNERLRVSASVVSSRSTKEIWTIRFSLSKVQLKGNYKKVVISTIQEKITKPSLIADLRMALDSAKLKLKTQSDDYAMTFIAQQFLCSSEFKRFIQTSKFKPRSAEVLEKELKSKNLVEWWQWWRLLSDDVSFGWVNIRQPFIPTIPKSSSIRPRSGYLFLLLEQGKRSAKRQGRTKKLVTSEPTTVVSATHGTETPIVSVEFKSSNKIPPGQVLLTLKSFSTLADEGLSQVIWYFYKHHYNDPARTAIQANVLRKLREQGLIESLSNKFSDAFKRSFERIELAAQEAGDVGPFFGALESSRFRG